MNVQTHDPEPSENRKNGEQSSSDRSHPQRQPFDTTDLARIPAPTADDPPYRNWWVVEPRGEG
jgi:hypothetical protein